MIRTLAVTGAMFLAMIGCNPSEKTADLGALSSGHMSSDKVDSVFPMSELIRRFRQDAAEVQHFSGGDSTRETLARHYLKAVARNDSAALSSLLINRAEFAWLFFPDHLYSREPYALDPAIFWLQLGQETGTGMHRVLTRYGGQALQFVKLDGCQYDPKQTLGGPDSVWTHCLLKYRLGDSTLTRTLFGSIVQREGMVKFLSYHTEF